MVDTFNRENSNQYVIHSNPFDQQNRNEFDWKSLAGLKSFRDRRERERESADIRKNPSDILAITTDADAE